MQVIFVPMEPAVPHGCVTRTRAKDHPHGPELKTIKRRREFTPRRNELVREVACWRCHQQRLVHVPGQPSAEVQVASPTSYFAN